MSTRALFHTLKWQLPPAQKLLAIFIGDQADDDGQARFRVKRACSFTSLSERTIRSALGDLERAGRIRVMRISGQANRVLIAFPLPTDEPVDNAVGNS